MKTFLKYSAFYRRSFLLLFLLFSITYSYGQSWTLVWSDEFDTPGLPDTSKWTYDIGNGVNGWGNNELEYYTADREENARMENGNLVITARKENFDGKSYTSARLKTEGKASWRYGKIEARIKLPYGQGMWPAFWMLGNNITSVGWPACGEIDIMEMIGGAGRENTVHGTAHWDDNGHQSSGDSKMLPSGNYADTFHIFSIEWNPWFIKWYVDGSLFHALDITPSAMSEFHQPFFIILNVAVGGNWPGSPDATTAFPQTMTVDYIRVYADSASLADVPSWPGYKNRTDHLRVYPNPANHFIMVKMQDDYAIVRPEKITMCNLNGQTVLEKLTDPRDNHWDVNVGHLQNGMYILRIYDATGSVQRKIIVN